MGKRISILFIIIVFLLTACGKTESEKTNEDRAANDNGKQYEQKEEVMLLTEQEIREVMDQYFEIVDITYEFINDSQAMYLNENDSYMMDGLLEYMYDNYHLFEQKASQYATNKYINNHRDFLEMAFLSYGEDTPYPNYDLRFRVLKNTPEKIIVHSIVEPMIYGAEYNIIGDNFYITAVNQNGRWLIDEIETTEAPDDPVNFSEDEMLQFIESNNLTYLGKVVMNATIAYDYSTYYIDQQIKEIKENTVVFFS